MLCGRERGTVLVQQIETHHLLTLLYTMRQAHISNIVSRTQRAYWAWAAAPVVDSERKVCDVFHVPCRGPKERHLKIFPPRSLCSLLTYLLTYLLTPWCRVLPEQLTGLQLVKKFPAFHGTRRFITALTSACHLSLSWASPIQSIYPLCSLIYIYTFVTLFHGWTMCSVHGV